MDEMFKQYIILLLLLYVPPRDVYFTPEQRTTSQGK